MQPSVHAEGAPATARVPGCRRKPPCYCDQPQLGTCQGAAGTQCNCCLRHSCREACSDNFQFGFYNMQAVQHEKNLLEMHLQQALAERRTGGVHVGNCTASQPRTENPSICSCRTCEHGISRFYNGSAHQVRACSAKAYRYRLNTICRFRGFMLASGCLACSIAGSLLHRNATNASCTVR